MDPLAWSAFCRELEKNAGSLQRRMSGLLPDMVSTARSGESLAGQHALDYVKNKTQLQRWGRAGTVEAGVADEVKQKAQSALASHVQKTQTFTGKNAVPEVSKTQEAFAKHRLLREKQPEIAAAVAAGRRSAVEQAVEQAAKQAPTGVSPPASLPPAPIGMHTPKPPGRSAFQPSYEQRLRDHAAQLGA